MDVWDGHGGGVVAEGRENFNIKKEVFQVG